MRIARPLISTFVVLGLTLIGLHVGPLLARAADLTDLQSGVIVGVVITWAAFQITAMLPGAEPTAPDQD
jgi:hypothetical protein